MKDFIELVIHALHIEFAEYGSEEVDKMIKDSKIVESIEKYPEAYRHLTAGQIADRVAIKLGMQ